MKYNLLLSSLVLALVFACEPSTKRQVDGKPRIVVSYSILQSLIKDWIGDKARVELLMPNGADPHEWKPSARDMETIDTAKLVIVNGLGLEAQLETLLGEAQARGSIVLRLSDYFEPRKVKSGEGIPNDDADQKAGASDPHLWTDPALLASIIKKLEPVVEKSLGIDLADSTKKLTQKLEDLDKTIMSDFAKIPQSQKVLVTGHESIGYFAERYGLRILGAVVPSLSSQAEVSAQDLGRIKDLVLANKARVIFTELGTPKKVVQSLAEELGVKTVEIETHLLPSDSDYFGYMTSLARAIRDNL